jgi:2-oxoglutarate ferredoxin oxidoreductase subunit alpha
MPGDVFTFLVGGKAGEGVKKTGSVAARLMTDLGRYVFRMDDYQSLIKGGHNFTVVSSSTRPVTSHYMKADVVVALDKRSYEQHAEHLAEGGVFVYNSDTMSSPGGIGLPLTSEAKKYPRPELRLGVGAVVALATAIGLDAEEIKRLVKEGYRTELEENTAYAMAICGLAREKISGRFRLEKGGVTRTAITGNQAIALGAAAAGLDTYYAYPMTPVSPILHFLAAHDKELGVVAVQPENEIAAINMAIGSALAGARSMVGTSGGGFALMEEGFSLAGMAEVPLLCILGSRPGPSTGLATYTEQGDLNFALHQGHGEFPRIVASPGTIDEAFHLAGEMLDLVWRFQTPGILLTEKHLAESAMTPGMDPRDVKWPQDSVHGEEEYKRYLDTEDGVSPLLFPPSLAMIKWNSNEHDEAGITTEDPALTVKMHDKRARKGRHLAEHLGKMRTVNVYGDRGPLIFTYGSTTMSVLEALRAHSLDARVVQPVYLEPVPVRALEGYRGERVIVVEQSSTGQFASLLREKAGIEAAASIRKYDGRPFDPEDLAGEIEKVI